MMKRDGRLELVVLFGLILVLGALWFSQPLRTRAQEPALSGATAGTAFTYQGRLTDGGSPASGSYDLRFSLYDADVGGAQVGGPVSQEDISVTDGFFTVQLDFGAVFDGTNLWLEIAVRPGSDSGDYTPLAPRQPLLPTPYALNSASTSALQGNALSGNAPTAGQVLKWDGSQWKPDSDDSGGGGGPVSWHDLTDVPADLADGDGDTTYTAGTGLNLNASNTFRLESSYRLPQNCSTDQIIRFDGSSWVCAADPTADLEARLSALESLLSHVSRNGDDLFITGANLHVVNGTGTTDGAPNSLGNLIIGYNEEEPSGNDRSGSHMLVVGDGHTYSSYGGMVVGESNTASGPYASVSGGTANTASGSYASVSGGILNTASDRSASVSGGYDNTASGRYASVSGGVFNTVSGSYASVSGGAANTVSGSYASVSGGHSNTAGGDYASVSGGKSSTAGGSYASVSGGHSNTAGGDFASVSGGQLNTAGGDYASVSGGANNLASNRASSVSGGANNWAIGRWSTVSGGLNRSVSGDSAWRAGGYFQPN